ncbi:MAG: metal-dependent transcriptional regulator [Thermoplasmata archaeon]
MKSERVEEYLEALCRLTEEDKPIKTNQIASELGLSPSSVTEMLQKLESKGYIRYKSYYGATLTKKGRRQAQRMVRKHRIVERFLNDILRISEENIHEQACEMEHVISDEVEEALCRLLGYPEDCPDDEMPIPPCDKEIDSCAECFGGEGEPTAVRGEELISLLDMDEGDEGIVKFFRSKRELVRKLADKGLAKNTKIKIGRIDGPNGQIVIRAGRKKITIEMDSASKVFLTKE